MDVLHWFAGLIISGAVKSWHDSMNRLRLSQVLDMYYSNRGVNFDRKYRACERQDRLKEVEEMEDLLLTQVTCRYNTYSMEHSHSCEANPSSVKKLPAFYGTRKLITAVTTARHLSLS